MRLFYESVRKILDNGSVGVPVFLRWSVQFASEDEPIEDMLAGVTNMACLCMQTEPMRFYAKGGKRQITMTIQYSGGETAIIDVNSAPDSKDSMDFVLIGNKGALYHNTETAPASEFSPKPMPAPEWMLDVVKHSLDAGRPVLVGEVADRD